MHFVESIKQKVREWVDIYLLLIKFALRGNLKLAMFFRAFNQLESV